MSLGNFEAALAAYSSAALLLPNAAAAHASRAVACQKLGRSHEAAQAALRAISLDPSDATALKVLARIHLDAGQHEAAKQACGQVLRRDAQDEEAAEMMREAQAQAAKLAEKFVRQQGLPGGLTASLGSSRHPNPVRPPISARTPRQNFVSDPSGGVGQNSSRPW